MDYAVSRVPLLAEKRIESFRCEDGMSPKPLAERVSWPLQLA